MRQNWICLVLMLNIFVCGAFADGGTKTKVHFELKNLPYAKAIDQVAKAFNVRAFLGDGTNTKITADIEVNSFEEALTLLTQVGKAPWLKLHVTSGNNLTYEQVETFVRTSKDLKGLHIFLDNPSGQSISAWTTVDTTTGVKIEGETIYFIGKTRSIQPLNLNTTGTGLQQQQMRALFEAVAAMTAEQRDLLRKMLTDMEPTVVPETTDNSGNSQMQSPPPPPEPVSPTSVR